MVLSRAAFGRRGTYPPAAIQGLIATGWCAVNTLAAATVVYDISAVMARAYGVPGAARPGIGGR